MGIKYFTVSSLVLFLIASNILGCSLDHKSFMQPSTSFSTPLDAGDVSLSNIEKIYYIANQKNKAIDKSSVDVDDESSVDFDICRIVQIEKERNNPNVLAPEAQENRGHLPGLLCRSTMIGGVVGHIVASIALREMHLSGSMPEYLDHSIFLYGILQSLFLLLPAMSCALCTGCLSFSIANICKESATSPVVRVNQVEPMVIDNLSE